MIRRIRELNPLNSSTGPKNQKVLLLRAGNSSVGQELVRNSLEKISTMLFMTGYLEPVKLQRWTRIDSKKNSKESMPWDLVIQEFNRFNSSTRQWTGLKLSRKVFAIPYHNGEINELNPLNSSTEQGLIQNKLEKVSAWFRNLTGIKPVKFKHQAEISLNLSRKSLCSGPVNSGPKRIKPVKFKHWAETSSKLSRKILCGALQ